MKIFAICFLLISCASCNLKEKETAKVNTYFDLESYFKNEAKRLGLSTQTIDKTVSINGKTENKTVTINNWERELSAFTEADINKASWRGAFKKTVTEEQISLDEKSGHHLLAQTITTYTSDSEKIPIKKLEMMKVAGKISYVKIFIQNANDLYTSADSLSYYPDSLYEIKKVQKIKLMDEKRYGIRGNLKKKPTKLK